MSSCVYDQLPGNEPFSPQRPKHRASRKPRPQSSVTPRMSWVTGLCGPELPGPPCPQITPCLEAVALILLLVLVPDPPRGAAEKQGVVALGGPRNSWWEDIRYLWRK